MQTNRPFFSHALYRFPSYFSITCSCYCLKDLSLLISLHGLFLRISGLGHNCIASMEIKARGLAFFMQNVLPFLIPFIPCFSLRHSVSEIFSIRNTRRKQTVHQMKKYQWKMRYKNISFIQNSKICSASDLLSSFAKFMATIHFANGSPIENKLG